MNSIESAGSIEDWKEGIRRKLNLPVKKFAEAQSLFQEVQERFGETGTELTERQQQVLLHKLGLFVRANRTENAANIAEAIGIFPQVLAQRGKPDISDIVLQARQQQNKKGMDLWGQLSERNDATPMIAEASLSDGSYYLGRLFTRGHFVANSAVLEHCLGQKSLERYFTKSKNKDIEVYAVMQQTDSEPVATIIYDPKLKSILQIKQAGDQHLAGTEPYFDAVIEALSHLITQESIDESGRAYRRPIESVQDLEHVFRGLPEVFVRSGTLVSISDALAMNPKEVLGGSAFPVKEDTEPGLVAQVAERLPLAIDMTRATAAQRQIVEQIAGTLIDNRAVVNGFPNLTKIRGQVLANHASEIMLEALEEAGRGIYATGAVRASFPSLRKTGGRVDLPSARIIEAESLEEVAGNIDASSASHLSLPSLEKVGWHIEATTAERIDLPNLAHAGGKILGDSSVSISTPSLEDALAIRCNENTEVAAPSHVTIERTR